MKKRAQDFLRKEKGICGPSEDSKKTWQLCVRNGGVIVHETSMPAKFEVLQNYFHNRFPECHIEVIYEADFRGFELYDQLEAAGWDCIVTPPHTVTEEKCQQKKNDRMVTVIRELVNSDQLKGTHSSQYTHKIHHKCTELFATS